MPDDFDYELHTTTIHEAGHVIARLALGLGFVKVTANPCSDSLGRVEVTEQRFYGRDRYALLIDSLAGHGAEQLQEELDLHGEFVTREERVKLAKVATELAELYGMDCAEGPVAPHLLSWFFERGRLPNPAGVAEEDDYSFAYRIVSGAYDESWLSTPIDLFREAELATEQILRDHWQRLSKVAFSLANRKNRTMSFAQVCRLLAIDKNNTAAAFAPLPVGVEPVSRFRR